MSKNFGKVKSFYDADLWPESMVYDAVGRWITPDGYGRSLGKNIRKREVQNVTDEEIVVKLISLEHETKSAKHRIDDLEVQNKAIQDLTLSVRELTLNMGNMMEEQRRQGSDIEKLKSEPGENWGDMKRTMINKVVGAVAGAIATGIFIPYRKL